MRQPAYEMGKEAATLLIKLMRKEYVEQNHVEMPVTFIERETTREVEVNE
jgi:LacI family transcriptional regulator